MKAWQSLRQEQNQLGEDEACMGSVVVGKPVGLRREMGGLEGEGP